MVFDKEIYKGRFLVYKQDSKTGYEMVSRTSTVPLKEDAVIIIGMNIETMKYVCIFERRIAIKDHSGNETALGFPAGLTDGEGAEIAAERELSEETGYEIVNVNHVTPIIYNSEGMTDESCRLVYCDIKPFGKQDLQGNEKIEVVEMDTEDFENFLQSERYKTTELGAKLCQHFQTLIMYKNGLLS